ncbi:MAG: hemerythrin family protein [Lachnospiraceae bacterium]|nr:hemerythrin family protein [Lachnospiraceae bacterium]
MYEMKPEYYTGIESIDQEHAKLFELAQETQDLLNNDLLQDKTDSLFHLISELINYTKKHFSHEEEYQKSIGYANLKQHAAQHRAFEDRLMAFDLESIENDYEQQNKTVKSLLNFLVTWLVAHILETDMKYVEAGKANPK